MHNLLSKFSFAPVVGPQDSPLEPAVRVRKSITDESIDDSDEAREFDLMERHMSGLGSAGSICACRTTNRR